MSGEMPGNLPPDAERQVPRSRCALVVVGLLVGCCLLALLVAAWDRLLLPTPAAELHADLVARLAEAEHAWTELDDLWGRLAGGEVLSCQEEQVTRPYFVAWRTVNRVAYPSLAALADQLNSGLRRLHEAADNWTASCQSATADLSPAQLAAAQQSLEQARSILDAVSAALAETP